MNKKSGNDFLVKWKNVPTVFETKIDTRCPNIDYIDYLRENINLYIKVWVIFGTLSTQRVTNIKVGLR